MLCGVIRFECGGGCTVMQLQRRVCAREEPGLGGGRKTPCVGSATETGHLSVRDPFFEADEMMQDRVSPARSDTIQMSHTGFERRQSTNTQARRPIKPIDSICRREGTRADRRKLRSGVNTRRTQTKSGQAEQTAGGKTGFYNQVLQHLVQKGQPISQQSE